MAISNARKTVLKVLAIQCVVTCAIAAAALTLFGLKAAYSAVIGGGINVLATAYFAYQVFAAQPGSTAKSMMRALYWGELVKIVFTVILFSAVLLWVEVAFLPLFLAYAVTMLSFWIALPFTL